MNPAPIVVNVCLRVFVSFKPTSSRTDPILPIEQTKVTIIKGDGNNPMHDAFESRKALIVGQVPKREVTPDFRIDLESDCVYVRFAGTLTSTDIARYADALRKHPGFKDHWSEIVDLRSIEDFQITPDETIALADTIDLFSLSSRRAFTVANHLQFHAARMQQVLRSPSKSVGICENLADAEHWVRMPICRAPAASAQVLPFPLRSRS